MNDEWKVDDQALEKDVEAVCVTNFHGYPTPPNPLLKTEESADRRMLLWDLFSPRFFLSANRLFCNLTGFTKEELLGKSCTLIMPSSVASKHDNYMASYFNTGVKKLIGTTACGALFI